MGFNLIPALLLSIFCILQLMSWVNNYLDTILNPMKL